MDSGEDVELLLRRYGKEYCSYCGNYLRGSKILKKELQRIIDGVQKSICLKCKVRRDRQKLFVIVAIAVAGAVLLAIFI